MPRGKRKPVVENTLLTALNFVYAAQRATGALEATHCRLFGGQLFASNSILSAGHPVTEDIAAAPNTGKLIDALESAPGAVSLTLDADVLSVRSGDFLASIPVTDPMGLPTVTPDAAAYLCDDRLKAALTCVGTLALDSHEKLLLSTVQLTDGSVLATNNNVIMEYWHGVRMPPLTLVPKAFVTALNKATKPITRFGLSGSSFTVWFENGAWLKTQTYPTDGVPNLNSYLTIDSQPVKVPKTLRDIVGRLAAFSSDNLIHFAADGAPKVTYAIDAAHKDFPANVSFELSALFTALKFAETIHYNAVPGITVFYGENIRGVIKNK